MNVMPGAAERARIVELLGACNRDGPVEVQALLADNAQHRSFRVAINNELLVVRLPVAATRSAGRVAAEAAMQSAAAQVGLAPPLIHMDPRDGARVSAWLEGEVLDAAALAQTQVAAELGTVIARLQRLSIDVPALDLRSVARDYARSFDAGGAGDVRHTTRIERLLALVDDWTARERAQVAAHNDLVAGNVLRHAGRLVLLDWEFAARADALFDVAMFLGLHDVPAAGRAALLASAGLADGPDLETMIEITQLLCWAWAGAEAARHPEDARARQWLSRLEASLPGVRTQLSIIVPAWNEADELPATLTHLRQACGEIGLQAEFIVVDNASTDDTAALARKGGAQVVVEPRRGIARARNAGAAAAGADLLMFIDADTRPSAQLIDTAYRAMASGRLCGGGALVAFDQPLDSLAYRQGARAWNAISRRLRLAAGCFVFCTREAFEAVEGFNDRLYAGEEVFLSRRLARWGARQNQPFEVLDRPAVVTSARKVQWFSRWQHLAAVATVLVFPLALRSRRLSWFWYTRPKARRRLPRE
ncbi:MAG: glycosyltransferase [Gammaproteobacteria bacterium]|nr:glycosyltransferase [Gammaproteobacteria bacterium]